MLKKCNYSRGLKEDKDGVMRVFRVKLFLVEDEEVYWILGRGVCLVVFSRMIRVYLVKRE